MRIHVLGLSIGAPLRASLQLISEEVLLKQDVSTLICGWLK